MLSGAITFGTVPAADAVSGDTVTSTADVAGVGIGVGSGMESSSQSEAVGKSIARGTAAGVATGGIGLAAGAGLAA